MSKTAYHSKPKIFAAALATETNVFSSISTRKKDFEGMGGASSRDPLDPNTSLDPIFIALKNKAELEGCSFSFGFRLFAQPAGRVPHNLYKDLRKQLIDELSAVKDVDIVLLILHGAMATTKEDDCEGDILAEVRKNVGPKTVIVASLDPHAHLTKKMTDNSDILVFWKEYPHTDILPCTMQAFDLALKTHLNQIKPVMSIFDPHVIRLWPTQQTKIKEYISKLRTLENNNDILSISLVHGFPWGDNNDLGSKVLVISNNAEQQGKLLAESLGQQLWSLRNEDDIPWLRLEDIDFMKCCSKSSPITIADIADNAGGGAPQDATFILHHLIANHVKNVAILAIFDPECVEKCFDAGLNKKVELSIGGKHGKVSGKSLNGIAKVTGLCRDAYQTSFANTPVALGDVAKVEIYGIDVYLISERTQIFSPEIIEILGGTPSNYDFLVVKSLNHFYDAFSKISEEILFVTTPATLNFDIREIPYEKLSRPIWPRDLANDLEWFQTVFPT